MSRFLVALVLFGLAASASGQSVDLTATPATGSAPLPVTLAWSSTGVNSCTKDGVTVPTTGSESKTVTVDTTFAISCASGKDYTDLEWTAPTENVDGSAIPATGPGSLAGYELQYADNPAWTNVKMVTVPASQLTYRVSSLPNATYYYRVNAFNVEGLRSDWTGPVPDTINTIQVTDTALVDIQEVVTRPVYNVVKRTNGFVLVQVGTVPTTVACNSAQSVNGHYAVPVSAVTWSGSVRTIVTVSRCENVAPISGRLGTSATAVYDVVKRTNGFVLVQVGTVPLNTTCDANQSVNGNYAVPVSAVTWSGTVRPVVVARCVAQ